MLDHLSNASYKNENEDSKNIIFFAREALISGEGLLENVGKWPKAGKPIVMQIRE